jgi:hypothetical protein
VIEAPAQAPAASGSAAVRQVVRFARGRVEPPWADNDNAEALLHLLGDPWGVHQQEHEPYGYPAVPHPLGLGEIADHFAGNSAIGFSLVQSNGENRIVGIDIDERFEDRLAVVRDVICKRDQELAERRRERDRRRRGEGKPPIRGESSFEACTFCTNGSQPGRGKVLIAFAKPRSRSAMANFIAGLVTEARLDSRWGPETPQSIEHWPMTGVAACKPLRIGGRSRKPSAPMEQFFNLDGKVIELHHVVPVRGRCLRIFGRPEPATAPNKHSRRVTHALKTGVSKRGPSGTLAVNRTLYGLCRELVARSMSLAETLEIIGKVAAQSPDLDGLSAKTKDRRNPLSAQRVAKTYSRALADSEREGRCIDGPLEALNAKTRGASSHKITPKGGRGI